MKRPVTQENNWWSQNKN